MFKCIVYYAMHKVSAWIFPVDFKLLSGSLRSNVLTYTMDKGTTEEAGKISREMDIIIFEMIEPGTS